MNSYELIVLKFANIFLQGFCYSSEQHLYGTAVQFSLHSLQNLKGFFHTVHSVFLPEH